MRSSRYFLALFFGAMLVHTGAIAWVHHREGRIDAYAFNSLDCDEYYALARNIVRHGVFSQEPQGNKASHATAQEQWHTEKFEEQSGESDTWRTPGYPLFLAAGMLLVGDSPTALILIQHLTAIGSVLIFFKIVSRYLSPLRAAIASAILLIEPYHLFYSFWMLSTAFFILVLLLIWWAWERVREGAKARHLITLGFLSGFLVLIWPGAVLIPLFVVAGIAIHVRIRKKLAHHDVSFSPSPKRFGLSLVAIACLAPPLGWMARNKLVAGHFALSHQSGIVLAYFKATEVELWRQGRTEDRYLETSLNQVNRESPHRVWDEIDLKLAATLSPWSNAGSDLKWTNLAQGNKTPHDAFVISHALTTIARQMLLVSPANTIACGLVRVVENLVFPLGLALSPPKGVSTHRTQAALVGSGYVFLLFAAFVGAIRARKQWFVVYFPLACVIAMALTTAPQIDPRFRAPLIPLLAFLAVFPSRRAES